MLKTLPSAMCLAFMFLLLPAGPVFTFGADDLAQARQNPENKGSWVGFDFGEDDDDADDGDDDDDDDGDGEDDDDGGDDDEED